MGKPDIFLGQDETTVVKRLTIGVDQEKSPDIQLKPDVANIHLGGGGGNKSEGDVKLLDREGNSRVQLTAGGGREESTNSVFVDGETGNLHLGGSDSGETEGDVQLYDKNGDSRVQLTAGGGGEASTNTVLVDGETGNLHLGGGNSGETEGDVQLYDKNGDSRVQLTAGGGGEASTNTVLVDGRKAKITIGNERANMRGSIEMTSRSRNSSRGAVMDGDGNLTLGGRDIAGDVELLRSHAYQDDSSNKIRGDPAITLEADDATATVGGAGADGIVNMQNENGVVTAEVRGDAGQIVTGGQGTPGSILLKSDQAKPVGFLKASGDDVVFTTLGGGGNETVAMRIRPDGTVEFPQGGP